MPVTRSRGNTITVHPTECFFDIRSGSGVRRTLLGGCAYDRLILRQCMKAEAIDLYWRGSGLSRGTFSPALRRLLQECSTQLTGRRDPCEVIRLKDGLYWIARLQGAEYYLEHRADGGQELFSLSRVRLRRPGASQRRRKPNYPRNAAPISPPTVPLATAIRPRWYGWGPV